MTTGVSAGFTLSRIQRLERAYSFSEIHEVLKSAVGELIGMAEHDLELYRRANEEEASIRVEILDQYRLGTLIEERAQDFKSFFEQYVARVKCYDVAEPIEVDDAIQCMYIAYKLLLCTLENDPDPYLAIYRSWRGILELS